jgi:hypothetical protein
MLLPFSVTLGEIIMIPILSLMTIRINEIIQLPDITAIRENQDCHFDLKPHVPKDHSTVQWVHD